MAGPPTAPKWYNNGMLAFGLLTWWYAQGWSAAAMNVGTALSGISRLFSVPILLRTLFSPWKRIVTYPGASLDAKLRAYGDNVVSRIIGLTVRLLVLITALTISAIVLVIGTLYLVAWPLIPPAVVILVAKGILG